MIFWVNFLFKVYKDKDYNYLDAVHTVAYLSKDNAVKRVKSLESYQDNGAVSQSKIEQSL